MRTLLPTLRLLGQDLLSTLLFSGLVAATGNIGLGFAVGLAIGGAQIAYDLIKRRPVEALQWMSLALVVITGSVALLTHDPRIVLFKPTLIYVAIAASMLKRGWMNRYLPREALALVPDLGVAFGYVWAAAMAATGVFSAVLLVTTDLKTWALVMAVAPLASKALLVMLQYQVMHAAGVRRYRADPAAGAAALGQAA